MEKYYNIFDKGVEPRPSEGSMDQGGRWESSSASSSVWPQALDPHCQAA